MTIKFSADLRNSLLDQIETFVGTGAIIKFFTGTAPAAGPSAADSGTLLCTLTCPSDYYAAASGGTKALSGTWAGAVTANGTIGYFRIYTSASVCKIQGTVGTSGADMILSSVAASTGKTITISSATITAPNA